MHSFDAAAARAWLPDRAADTAVPVLTTALQGPQHLAALSADRRRDRLGSRLDQRDEQVPDDSRSGRPAIGEDRGPAGQGPGELAAFGPAAGDACHHRLDLAAI